MKLLRKICVKYGSGFPKARDLHTKTAEGWTKVKRGYIRTSEGWKAIHFSAGTLGLEVALVIPASGTSIYWDSDLVDLLKTQGGFSDDIISVYPFSVTLTIEEGVVLLSSASGIPALNIGGLITGSSVKIKNYGKIYGRGGKGGISRATPSATVLAALAAEDPKGSAGSGTGFRPTSWHLDAGAKGGDGGTAIKVSSTNLTVVNYSTGRIYGGGGGGAAGMPIVNVWSRYIRQRGGPKSAFGGVPTLGTTGSTPIKDSWIVMDIGTGGSGGGGAPYGTKGEQLYEDTPKVIDSAVEDGRDTFHAGKTRTSAWRDVCFLALIYDPRLRIHAGYYDDSGGPNDDNWVPTSACETDASTAWEKQGLNYEGKGEFDGPVLGAAAYYPEADTPQSLEEGTAGVLDGPTDYTRAINIFKNYKWHIRGTWYGMFWPKAPYVKDFVSKSIQINGPHVTTHFDRNILANNDGDAEGSNGSFETGGDGGVAGFSPVTTPKSTDFKAPLSAGGDDDGCSTLIKVQWDDGDASASPPVGPKVHTHYDADNAPAGSNVSSNVFGASSNGAKGGELGVDGESVTFIGRKLQSTYGGGFIADIGGAAWASSSDGTLYWVAGTFTCEGGTRGYAVESDDASSVSFVQKDGSAAGGRGI